MNRAERYQAAYRVALMTVNDVECSDDRVALGDPMFYVIAQFLEAHLDYNYVPPTDLPHFIREANQERPL
jgi:hypothetical protein